MKIVFLTKEPAVCKQIASRLPSSEYVYSISCDILLFYDKILRQHMQFDLIVCDFRLFNHDVFNIYEFLSEKKVPMPVIYYNDPYPEKKDRVLYWMSQNEEEYARYDFDYLRPTFERLCDIIEDPSVHPYISLLQPPLPVSAEDFPDGVEYRAIDLPLLRRRNNLTPALFRLLECMYKRRNEELSVKEIERMMWGSSLLRRNRSRRSSVYSYISRLRKSLVNDKLVKIEIVRTAIGFYRMIVY